VPSPFVPDDFQVPVTFAGTGYSLEPLGPHHNERDHQAWMSSIDHIHATPGFEESPWPEPMTLEQNLADLEQHARDFEERTGFTYSIVDESQVVGCLYIYPTDESAHDASVRSWVRQDRAALDRIVWTEVTQWLKAMWPFARPRYAARFQQD
jgi:hypothetical protein